MMTKNVENMGHDLSIKWMLGRRTAIISGIAIAIEIVREVPLGVSSINKNVKRTVA